MLKIIMGELTLKQLQHNSIYIELEQLKANKSELRAKTFDTSRPFNKRQAKSEAEFESSMLMNKPHHHSTNFNDTQYGPNNFQKLLNV